MAIFINPLRPSESSGGVDEDFVNNKLNNYVTKDTIGDINQPGLVHLYATNTNGVLTNKSGLALSTDNGSGNPVNRLYVACRDGIKRTGSGEIAIDAAVESDINALSGSKPIVPSKLKYAVEKIIGIGNINQPGLVQLRTVYANGVPTNYSGLHLESNKLFVNCLGDKGVRIDMDNNVSIAAATLADIDAKTNSYKPIVPDTLEYAVKSVIGTYSSEPQKIGTWIDGTPVWRVCIDQEFDEQFFADLEGAFQTGEDNALNDFISIDTTKFCKNMNNIVAITHAYLYIVPKSGSCIVDNLPLTISSNTPYNLTFNYPQGATGNGNIDNLQDTWYGVQGVLEFVTPINNIKLN